MRKVLLTIVLIASFQTGHAPARANPPQGVTESVEQQIQKSSYIFVGTVQKKNATTMPLVPASDRTAIVRVEEVLSAPKTLADYTGRDVTVQLRDGSTVKAGDRLAFFTNGGMFGGSVALVEVGHVEAGRDTQDLRRQIAQAFQEKDDEDLGKRIAKASLIVAGKVLKTGPAKLSERQPLSEHDPQWQEAEIAIEVVQKGQFSAHTVSVLFAGSTDMMWFRSPKLKEGEDGIWLLHKGAVRWPGIKDRYLVVDPLDFQPRDQGDRVKRLLARGTN
jgi:hypothetical protein